MADVLKEIFGKDTDQKQARMTAKEVAALLGSKVVSNNRIIIGEPYCPFKMALHTKEFCCFVLISDESCCFTANRRPETPFVADFFVSLKAPDRTMGARFLSANLSEKIGVNVFRQRFCTDTVIESALSRLADFLRRIDFSRISQFHFSPIQLRVVASLDSPELCAKHALVFRGLIAKANQQAYDRNKQLLR